MPSILKNPTHRAQIGYDGHDMSFINSFSSTAGELLPVLFDLLSPGDKINIKHTLKTRTQPLASGAMAQIVEHVDYFFVPIEQIYQPFRSLFYGVNDNKTSLIGIGNLSPDIPAVPSGTASDNFVSTILANARDEWGLQSAPRLLHMLNIPVAVLFDGYNPDTGNENSFDFSWSPLLLCAYQKVYNDFYRLDDREDPIVSAFNLDDCYQTGVVAPIHVTNMCRMRYRPRRKDFFTNVFVSPIFSPNGIGGIDSSIRPEMFHQWLVSGLDYKGLNATGAEVFHDNDLPTSVFPENNQVTTANVANINASLSSVRRYLSPTSIRTSFAVQKLLEITRRAGKSYDAQTLAHFGVSVPKGLDGQVFALGQFQSDLVIGDIIATASGTAEYQGATSSSVLGQVGGKGYGFGESKPISFTAPCHGILIALYSCEPIQDYNTSRLLDRLNTYCKVSDFYHPEYDNLGMQPLFRYQSDVANGRTVNSNILGWQYRWSELKIKYNQIHGSLAYSLNYWVLGRIPQIDSYLSSFLVDPRSLDSIMLVSYLPPQITTVKNEENFGLYFDTDPLFHQIKFDYKKASKMDVYSLENL